MPYITAITKEIFRIRPLTGYGTPHCILSPTRYKETSIPAHTFIKINQYALHFDQNKYADADTINPSRYLSHPHSSAYYASQPNPSLRDQYNLGAGHRICPGMHLAEISISIVLSKLLWSF
jgi:cytochrome P450